MHPYSVLSWEEAKAAGPAVVGGKGWNLGRLHRYGFPVPVGGVLPSSAYHRFMAHPSLAKRVERLRTMSAEEATSPANAHLLKQIQATIVHSPLPDEMVAHLRDFLRKHDLDATPLAVRSSATAEDGATASFAGIHESRLGQIGLEAVIDGIRTCYASLWTPRAIAYRRRLNLTDEDVACAVVLCRMIGADNDPHENPIAAGVALSCDPRTGRYDVVTIGAVPGLGTTLVDGSANPDAITVRNDVRFAVIERSGTGETVLTDEQALRLAHMTARIQWALGDGQQPQDVEWAFDGDRFWVIQARPVTGLPRYTFEGAKQLPLVWSNANLKDALPGVLSPLGWSMCLLIVRHNLFAPHIAAGYAIPPGMELMRRFSGRAYFDLTSLFWAFYDALGMTPSEFNRSLGGHQPEFAVSEPNPMKGPGAGRRKRARPKVLRAVLRLDKTLPGEMQDRMEELQRQRGENLSGLTMQQLRHRLHQEIENGYDFSMRSMLANTSAGLWHQFLELAVKKAIPEGAMTVTSDLQAGSGNVVSAEYGYRLLDLARVARDDADARKLLEADPLVGLQWRQLPEQSPFRRQMEQFIADFGHRGVYEVDMGNPRWVEDPTYVLKHVRELLYTDTNESFETLGQQRREKAEQTVARHTFFLRPLIRWLARRARHGAALREAAKSTLVSYLEPCRNIVLEVGRRMHEANIIADANDVIYLTWIEVDAFMSTWWDGNGAKALIHDRKVQRKTWLTEEPPDVITDDAPTYAPEPSTAGQPDVPVSGSTLRGTGVAAGVASGRVRILRHPDEGHQLKAGEILVAPSTDPGWTPLFMRAAAIAMEVGGYHSHGAIVAREFGIPAVANIPGLLSALRDGDTVTVHGDDGTIHWTVPR